MLNPRLASAALVLAACTAPPPKGAVNPPEATVGDRSAAVGAILSPAKAREGSDLAVKVTTTSRPPSSVVTRGGPFIVWERTYICISAEVEPGVKGLDYTKEANDNVAGNFSGALQLSFRDAKLSQKVPGDTMGERFSRRPLSDPRCQRTPENIFVAIKVSLNDRGNPFTMNFTATQDGRSFSQTVERHVLAERNANPRPDEPTLTGLMHNEAGWQGRSFAMRLMGQHDLPY